MKRIFYMSRATSSLKEADLAELANKSAEKNKRLGITGYLSYLNGKFLECLEGGEKELNGLLGEIRRDPRHEFIDELSWEQIPKRLFASWMMRNVTKFPGVRPGGTVMKRIFYISQALVAFTEDDLAQLVVQAAAKNEGLGITGYLSYSNGRFMQYLEGEAQVVDDLLDEIRRDPRHEFLHDVAWDNVDTRLFGKWSMRQVTVENLLKFNHKHFVAQSDKFPRSAHATGGWVGKSVFYVSQAKVEFSEADLSELVEKAVEKNVRLGITGYLSFSDGLFLQFFEGGEQEVDGLLREIRSDPRHEFLYEVAWDQPAPRLFAAWAMRHITVEEILKFDHEDFIQQQILFVRDNASNASQCETFAQQGVAHIAAMHANSKLA